MVKITFEAEGKPKKVIECETAIGATLTETDTHAREFVFEAFFTGENDEIRLLALSIQLFKYLFKAQWELNPQYTLEHMQQFMELVSDKAIEEMVEEYQPRNGKQQ